MKIDYINDLISTKYYSTNKELFKYIDIKSGFNANKLEHFLCPQEEIKFFESSIIEDFSIGGFNPAIKMAEQNLSYFLYMSVSISVFPLFS